MSESRDALTTRFRATLRARLLRVAQLFDASNRADSTNRESRRHALAELHTLKGEARLLGLTTLAGLAHELESQAAESAFAADWSRWLEPMRLELEDCTSSAPASSSRRGAASAERVPLEPMLRELSRHAQAQAEQAGKVLRAEVRAGGVALERFMLDELGPALLHLLENAVDHGLELPHERGDKPQVARLLVSAERQGARVVLRVEDDGRGIDLETIRVAAVTRGMHGATRAAELGKSELLELLFEHGFSTRSDVTLISGRGVGLDVVRRRVESLAGQVAVESELGRGTRFVISIPSERSDASRAEP